MTAALLASAMAGCASDGPRYPEIIAEAGPPPEGHARIVLLRPDERFDNYSLSRARIDVNGREFGRLSYGGFLYVDVNDETLVEARVRNRWAGTCALRIRPQAGDTIYLDVAPRPVSATDIVTAAIPAAVVGPAASTFGDVLAESAASGAIGAAVDAASAVITSAGKPCGGPFRMKPLAPDDAKKHLERLSWSG
ncbi:MAG: hypothetical protein WD793_07635 [Steroidobacteraceae bacterium]